MTPSILILLLSLSFQYTNIESYPINITIFLISNTEPNKDPVPNTGGPWLAIQEINNSSDLSNYVLNLKVFDAKEDSQKALIHALDIVDISNTKTPNELYFPIVLGAPWSSLSTSIAPVLAAYNMGQISQGSTSVTLSQTRTFPYFYRTIPSDALQSQGLLLLCREFNWRKIAVVYVNDPYGSYLSLAIQELAISKYDIDVTSIAISYEDDSTYNHAAKLIKNVGVYVIIMIIHSSSTIYKTFDEEGILGYPYFYLGTDAWFGDTKTIAKWNFTDKIEGFVGTVPWQANSLDLDTYNKTLQSTINQSMSKLNDKLKLWHYLYDNGYDDQLHTNEPYVTMPYAYDAMYTIAKVIQEIDNNHQVSLNALLLNDTEYLIKIINDTITNKIDFNGLSGRVVFDANGDRILGLYSFGNNLINGSTQFFGYLYQDEYGNLIYEIDGDKIIWPSYFTERGIIPRLDIVIHKQIISIDMIVSTTMFLLLGISLLIAVVFVLLLIFYRKKTVIKAVSWKLNVIMCIGGILFYTAGGLYGKDESFVFKEKILNYICNLRIWIISISYTLLFMPLFEKTHRLALIFTTVLEKKQITDAQLMIRVFVCVGIDIIILTLFMIFNPLKRDYQISKVWMWIGSCSSINGNQQLDWLFYGMLLSWKVCELTFGVYVGLEVSRIQDTTNYLRNFKETGIQLLSILFTFFIICITIPILVFGHNIESANNKPNFDYVVISVIVLLTGNIVLCFNLFPRISAVITGNEGKFKISPEQRMIDKIKKKLQRYNSTDIGNDDERVVGVTLQQ